MRLKLKRNHDPGFAFIEILIAVLVLAVAIIGLTAMLTHGVAWVFEAGGKSTDMYLSQKEMENRIRAGTTGVSPGGLNITIQGHQPINVPGANVVITRGKANINAFLPQE